MSRRQAICAAALAFALAFTIITLVLAKTAAAHTGYCGHRTSPAVWIATPWGLVEYRDIYASGYGSGPHRHNYRTVYWSTSKLAWVTVHSHYGRLCKPHATIL